MTSRRFIVAPRSEVEIPIVALVTAETGDCNDEVQVSSYYADEERVRFAQRMSFFMKYET